MIFRERLRGLRNRRGITQNTAAEKIGLTGTGYRNYELGTRRPTFEILSQLADFYDVSADYLLGRSDEPQMPDAETWKLIRQLQAYKAKEQEKEQSND